VGDDGTVVLSVIFGVLAVGDLPLSTGLPPLVGTIIVAAWVAVVALLLGLLWRLRSSRGARRSTVARRADGPSQPGEGQGTDLERW